MIVNVYENLDKCLSLLKEFNPNVSLWIFDTIQNEDIVLNNCTQLFKIDNINEVQQIIQKNILKN